MVKNETDDRDEPCGGHCSHPKHYHLVKLEGDESGARGCCKVDCPCMKFVPRPKPAQA